MYNLIMILIFFLFLLSKAHGNNLNCPSGKYVDQNVCTDCPVGFYQAYRNRNECFECALPFSQDQSGQASCKCDNGVCDGCIPGEYATVSGCQECPVGYFRPEDDDIYSPCVECSVGKYQDESATYNCKVCSEGSYQDELARGFCKLCELGKYQNEAGATECKVCPHMTQSRAGEGSTDCDGTIQKAEETTEKVYLYCPSMCPHNPCSTGQTCVDGKCVDHTCEDNAQASGCICYGSECTGYCMDNGACVDILENPSTTELENAFYNGVSQQD